jgi:hypothetical protein
MRFDYMKERLSGKPKKEWPKKAKLPVTLYYGTNKQNQFCLIDSGADLCLFHSSIGRLLGIDVTSGPEKLIGGITGSVTAYMHTINLQVQGIPDRVEIYAGFTDSDQVEALLGQEGFFDNFMVGPFERYRWQFDVNKRPAIR